MPDPPDIDSGKRDAVRHKSVTQVAHSCTVLKGPTLSDRAGQKPDACPVVSQGGAFSPCASAQSGKAERSSAAVAVVCSSELDRESVDAFIAVFRLLDEWERNLHGTKVM
jgi:hypothetical protein